MSQSRQQGGRKANRRSARRAAKRRRRAVQRIAGAAVVGLVVIGVILAMVLSGDGGSGEPSLAVTVEGSDFAFHPDPAQALAGDVSITLDNKGSAGHELIVLEQGARIFRPDDFNEEMSLGRIPSIAKDSTATITVSLEPGTYQFVCLLPGHFEAGMESDLIVQ